MPGTGANFQGCVIALQGDRGSCVRRDTSIEIELSVFYSPRGLRQSIGSEVGHSAMRKSAARSWTNVDAAVARLGGSQTADRPVYPIRDRAEGIMVEGRHLTGVDRSIG